MYIFEYFADKSFKLAAYVKRFGCCFKIDEWL